MDMDTVMERAKHYLRGVQSKVPNEFDWKTISILVMVSVYVPTMLCFYFIHRDLTAVKSQAMILEAKLSASEVALGNRFAYINADIDAAKAQIREATEGVHRLSRNAITLVEYLKNRDTSKHAPKKR